MAARAKMLPAPLGQQVRIDTALKRDAGHRTAGCARSTRACALVAGCRGAGCDWSLPLGPQHRARPPGDCQRRTAAFWGELTFKPELRTGSAGHQLSFAAGGFTVIPWLDLTVSRAVIHARGRLLDFEVMVRPLRAMNLLQRKMAQMPQAMGCRRPLSSCLC